MSSLTSTIAMLLVLAGTGQPSTGRPATSEGARDVQIRINGPIRVGPADTASAVWVVNHDATVDGVVRDGLGVINGDARINGSVEGGVVVVNGHLSLGPGARVGRDVMLYRSSITRANDAVIGGVVHDESGFSIGAGAIWMIWVSFTIVVVLAGLLFAELAPVTLEESTTLLATHGGRAGLTALLVMTAMPGLAVLSFLTVIGIPLGLMLLVVVIPALSLLGYLVAGSVLGSTLVGWITSSSEWQSRYRTVVIGLVALQCIAALPVVGGLIGFVSSLLGVGALVARSWARRVHAVPPPAPVAVGA